MQHVLLIAVTALLTFGLDQADQPKPGQDGNDKQKKMGTRPPVSLTCYVSGLGLQFLYVTETTNEKDAAK